MNIILHTNYFNKHHHTSLTSSYQHVKKGQARLVLVYTVGLISQKIVQHQCLFERQPCYHDNLQYTLSHTELPTDLVDSVITYTYAMLVKTTLIHHIYYVVLMYTYTNTQLHTHPHTHTHTHIHTHTHTQLHTT